MAAWEQRKLGELGEFNPKAMLPDYFEYVDLESVVGTEMIGHRRENRAMAPSRAQRIAQTGDIFYQTVRPYQRNNYLYELPDEDYVFSTGYAQIRPSIDSRFLFFLLQQDSFVADVLDRCTGTSYPAINADDLADIEVSAPADTEEQKLIGRSISFLENLITLHRRKQGRAIVLSSCLGTA
jgi:type I restriction enzyme S subunit